MSDMNDDKRLRTDSCYATETRRGGGMTPAAEDYLEMIYRLSDDGPVRICDLAAHLSVSPSSASRMAQAMALRGYIDFKRYGYITVTDSGREMGHYLLRRHDIVKGFLSRLRPGVDMTTETERIEHYLSRETVEEMAKYVQGAGALFSGKE